MSIDWSKAPVDFPIWLEDLRPSRVYADDHDRSSWACDAQGEYTLYCLGGSRGWWTKSREGIDFIVHRQPGPWNGEGLPPVGAWCKLSGATADLTPLHPEWADTEVKIYAHFESDRGVGMAAYVDADHMRGGVGIAALFIPIRTAEQIAAEERESHVLGMLCHDALGGSRRGLAEALYDAGYRKQVQP